MKNTVCFTTVYGIQRYAEFDRVVKVHPIRCVGGRQYYNVYVTGVVYTDTGETEEKTGFGLFSANDAVMYRGKTYRFDELDRLCMVAENENNLAALESL